MGIEFLRAECAVEVEIQNLFGLKQEKRYPLQTTMRAPLPFLVSGILLLVTCLAPRAAAAEGRAGEKPTFWIIPHTHWEGAVFKTREEYLEMGLPHILQVVYLLKTQPDYRFVLDQVAYVRPFLERYPEQEADFRRFLKEGRLQLVLGLDVMPDVNMPGGETFIRQMQYGKGYYRRKLGVEVTAG